LAVPFSDPPTVYRIDPGPHLVLGQFTAGGQGAVSALGGDGAGPGAYLVTLIPGPVVTGQDFGDRARVGTVSGVTYNDFNGNAQRDPGEGPLAGWTVYADLDRDGQFDAGEPSTVTAADGSYTLTVPVGLHTIRQAPPPGWTPTAPLVDRVFLLR